MAQWEPDALIQLDAQVSGNNKHKKSKHPHRAHSQKNPHKIHPQKDVDHGEDHPHDKEHTVHHSGHRDHRNPHPYYYEDEHPADPNDGGHREYRVGPMRR